jgi:MtfA peptidase
MDYTFIAGLGLAIASVGFLLYFIVGFTVYLLEPIFMATFARPFYVHFYLKLKKLDANARRHLDKIDFYRRLSPKHKGYFEHRVASFISAYKFYGKGGLQVTDQMKVMVAATYIMLTYGLRNYKIRSFRSILIYPDVYLPASATQEHKGEFNPAARVVVFSWKHFLEGFDNSNDNLNLGIHEFAHALHHYGMQRGDTAAANFSARYNQLLKEIHHPPNAKRLIASDYFRIYAYTNEFEFLAVILEHFFETPGRFRKEFPELYQNVSRMINLDPVKNNLYTF